MLLNEEGVAFVSWSPSTQLQTLKFSVAKKQDSAWRKINCFAPLFICDTKHRKYELLKNIIDESHRILEGAHKDH